MPIIVVDADPTAGAQALAAIQAYCGWHVAPSRSETLVLDGSGATVQLLPSLHVTEITAVTDYTTEVDVAELEWSAAGFMRHPSWLWTGRLRGVSVTLTHGFAAMPDDLAGVILSLSAITIGSGSQTAGPFTITAASQGTGPFAIGEYEMSVLDKYRIPGLL